MSRASLCICAVLLLFVAALPRGAAADACDDSYLLDAAQPSPSSQLTVAQINAILKAHNDERRIVSPPAKTMPMLRWKQELADFAREYMGTCVGMKHSSNTVRSNMTRFGFSYVGENLAAGTGSNYEVATGGVSSTLAWNSEKQYYTYSTGACTDVCGHYTQAVWAATTHIGCGYARCDSQPYKNYWSCVYGPGGNYQGQKPWAQAASASEYAACQKVGGTSAPGTPAPPTTTVAATPRPSTAAPTTAATGSSTTGTATTAPRTSAQVTSVTSTTAPRATTTAVRIVATNVPPPPQTTAARTVAPSQANSTVAPSSAAPATRMMVRRYRVRLGGSSWAAMLETSRATFEATAKADIAVALGVASSRVNVILSVGSLIVDASISSDDVSEPELADASVITAAIAGAPFVSVRAAYVTSGGSATEDTSVIEAAVVDERPAGGASVFITSICVLISFFLISL